ncbi:hypothetical protein C466_07255 [Halorubrum distributum JCM 10118]|uniref:Uncharacterized protein n=1 Tax=Halorubrum distributum JCM 10118 TaxID=1227468 RepID=M0F1R4_9EURY|nr:hypothetical protein C466_07255 [Halorubrum distributum JCM 10118]
MSDQHSMEHLSCVPMPTMSRRTMTGRIIHHVLLIALLLDGAILSGRTIRLIRERAPSTVSSFSTTLTTRMDRQTLLSLTLKSLSDGLNRFDILLCVNAEES